MAIYVTDGAANLDVDRTLPNAIEARNDGILLVAVSVGLDANIALLAAIVTRPPEAHLFVLMSSSRLSGYLDQVIDATCNNINECLANPCQSGGTCIDKVYNVIIAMNTMTSVSEFAVEAVNALY